MRRFIVRVLLPKRWRYCTKNKLGFIYVNAIDGIKGSDLEFVKAYLAKMREG